MQIKDHIAYRFHHQADGKYCEEIHQQPNLDLKAIVIIDYYDV